MIRSLVIETTRPILKCWIRKGQPRSRSPPFSDELEKEGYPVILDPNKVFP